MDRNGRGRQFATGGFNAEVDGTRMDLRARAHGCLVTPTARPTALDIGRMREGHDNAADALRDA